MLDAKQLEALAAVVDLGGFSAAARALHVTLPAVSARIKALEEAVGQRLLIRGKQVRATPAGQSLLMHARQIQLMEADLMQSLHGGSVGRGDGVWQEVKLAVNADSVAAWFLPGMADAVWKHRLLLHLTLDDQEHTHGALMRGEVVGCVSTQPAAMRGCVAEPLGTMRYAGVMARDLWQQVVKDGDRVGVHELLRIPALTFNDKDGLQDAYFAKCAGLRQPSFPKHRVPSVDGFETALSLGMGWGMVPVAHKGLQHKLHSAGAWMEIWPGQHVDVPLYWHHWSREPQLAAKVTQAVQTAAAAILLPI